MHTELGGSQVEVQRCTLRSSGAHWAGQVPGWRPAVLTELGEELAKSLAEEKAEDQEDEEEEDDDEEKLAENNSDKI